MSDLKRKIIRAFDFWTRLLAGIAITFFLAVGVVRVPKWQVQRDLRADRISWSDVPQQENEYRKTLIQIAGGVVVAIGLYLTWRRIQATEESQVTDRFSKAVEQLGDDSLEVRLGGIYALERIAEDSPRDHWTVMETLSAFVRENASSSGEAKYEGIRSQVPQEVSTPDTDVQAACTVIRRRRTDQDPEKTLNLRNALLSCVDLTGADLSGAILKGINLTGADLRSADLSGADLRGADLSGAGLVRADLSGADLMGADLSGADLMGGDLSEANLTYATLLKADLAVADLSGAKFVKSYLTGALLMGANLSGADLKTTDMQGAVLQSVDLSGAALSPPDLCSARTLYEAQLDLDVEDTVKSQCPELLKDPTNPDSNA